MGRPHNNMANTALQSTAPNPAPVTNPAMTTPFTTPRTSPAYLLTWSEDSTASMVLTKSSTLPNLLHLHSRLPYELRWHHHPTLFVDMLKGWYPDVFTQTFLASLLYKEHCSECMNGRYALRNVNPHYSMYVITDGQNCITVSYNKQSVKCLNELCALLNANPC